MTKGRELLKRTFLKLIAGTFVLGLTFIMSCDSGSDDPPTPEPYDLSGVYTFKKATLQTTLNIPGIPIPIPAGRDITDEMAGGLLAEAPCKDPDNGAVELKSNNKLFFACIGEDNELDAGTWSVDGDYTELTLNLSISTGNLALIIGDLTIDEDNDVISGKITNFPITKPLIAGFLSGIPGADAILAGIDDNITILVDVDIEFQKVTP